VRERRSLIGPATMALYPAYHERYRTTILDRSGEKIFSEKSIMELLDEACMLNGASYDGRVKAVRHVFPYFKKTPLMISKEPCIFAFPTMSPQHYECTWLFCMHIEDFTHSHDKTYVHFKNGCALEVDCSIKVLHTQRERAAAAMNHFVPIPLISLKVDNRGEGEAVESMFKRLHSSLLPDDGLSGTENQL
jgi:competence protein ComK